MEINLLNRTGIHTKDNCNFTEVDKAFMSNDLSESNKDFESKHKVNKNIPIKKSDKKKLVFLCFVTTLIIGASIYYKFFINQKTFIDSQKLKISLSKTYKTVISRIFRPKSQKI